MKNQIKLSFIKFDHVLYSGNIDRDFFWFNVKKNPLLFFNIFWYFIVFCLNVLTIINDLKAKQFYYSYLKNIKDLDKRVDLFYLKNDKKINYKIISEIKERKIVITQLPEFLIEKFCNNNKLEVLGSTYDKECKKFNILEMNIKSIKTATKNFIESEDEEIILDKYFTNNAFDDILIKCFKNIYIVKKKQIISITKYKPTFSEKFVKLYFSKSFLLFVFCGGIGTITNFCVSSTFSLFVDNLISYVLGYVFSLLITYYLTSKLIFKKKISLPLFLKFIISYIPNFIILFSFVAVFLKVLMWNNYLVYLMAGVLGIPITYVLLKIYAFLDKSKTKNNKKKEEKNYV